MSAEQSSPVRPNMPEAVRDALNNWVGTINSAATVSTLLASVASQLLSLFKSAEKSSTTKEVMLGFTYTSLLLSLSATISALVITGEFYAVPVRHARTGKWPQVGNPGSSSLDMLKYYGLWKSFIVLVGSHWLSSLIAAFVFAIVSIVLYVWTEEPRAVKGLMSFVAVFALLTLPALLVL